MIKVKTKKNNKRAFSLLELSITIIVVAVLVAAIAAATSVTQKAQEIFSESSTTNSTVTSVQKLMIWLETTNSSSFDKEEFEVGEEINNWYDKAPSSIKINAVSTVGEYSKKPILVNNQDLKKILDFERKGYFTIDGGFFNNSNYAVFVVAATRGSNSCDTTLTSSYCLDNFFIGEDNTSSSKTNKIVALGYSYDGSIVHSRGGEKRNISSKISFLTAAGSKADYYKNNLSELKIYSFTHSQHFGNKTYENGSLVSQDSDTDHVQTIGDIAIGKDFDGRLGEIIIYAKNLDERERYKIEDYLGQKWGIKITHEECLNGVVVDGVCVPGCSVNEVGITTSSVSSGDGHFSCDTSNGFIAKTISYECVSTVLSVSDDCECSTGYHPSGGVCIDD